jgi:hypothetical protein
MIASEAQVRSLGRPRAAGPRYISSYLTMASTGPYTQVNA